MYNSVSKTCGFQAEYPRSSVLRPQLLPRDPKLVAILILMPVRSIDLIAVAEVFAEANRTVANSNRYQVRLITAVNAVNPTSQSGLFTYASSTYERLSDVVDTLIVIGADEFVRCRYEDKFMHWLQGISRHARRIVSISSGTFLLADAGLLEGRNIAMHWKLQERILKEYSRINLVKDVLYIRDGNIYTCAGATAVIDLTLALVEEDYGPELANDVSRSMLLYLRRAGLTSQVSVTLEAQGLQTDRVKALIAWLPDNLRQDLSVASLAKRSAMSPRNFARLFKKEVGATPVRHIHNLRLEAAKRQLTNSNLTIEGVAEACGFPSVETLRRLFSRRLEIAPGQYRSGSIVKS